MYHTGDFGKISENGCLFHLGRKDFQAKIRGYRVEFEEIENTLLQYELVKAAIVIAKKNLQGDQYLIAYLIARNEYKPNRGELRQFLGEKLPEYMIPSAFIFLDTFPLTPNGKINRKALTELQVNTQREDILIVAPRT